MLDKKQRIKLERFYPVKDPSENELGNLTLQTGLPLRDILQFNEQYVQFKKYFEDKIFKKEIKPLGYHIKRLIGPSHEQDRLAIGFNNGGAVDKETTLQDFTRSLDSYVTRELAKQKERFNVNFWDKILMMTSWDFKSFVFLRVYKDLILKPNVVTYGVVK